MAYVNTNNYVYQPENTAVPGYLTMEKSIYIPKVHFSVDENFIYNKLIEFGQIYRIDFVPVYKKPGFQEDMTANMKSAFVHFANIREDFEYRIRTEGRITFYTDIGTEYWIILEAKNPIQPTMMNNAQIVDNCRYLENMVNEQQEKIQDLETKLERVSQVVYQLLGGLYNQETQKHIIQEYFNCMYPEHEGEMETNNTNLTCSPWPTTRQGDEHEKRIEVLEKVVCDIYNVTSCLFNDEENEVSTHSSMPELITPYYDDSEDDGSVPELYDVSSASSYESLPSLERKIRNSYELCGNN
jgi:hypothetical protein